MCNKLTSPICEINAQKNNFLYIYINICVCVCVIFKNPVRFSDC